MVLLAVILTELKKKCHAYILVETTFLESN